MKNFIRDSSQIVIAVVLTASIAVANAAPIKQHDQVVQSAVVKTSTPAATEPAQEAVPAPDAVVDTPAAQTPVVAAPVASQPVYTGSHEDWMAAAGIAASDYVNVDFVISHESGWNPCAYYPSHSDCSLAASDVGGACGLGMSLPCGKWGANWTDPVGQLVGANGYVLGKYGSWAAAAAHWQAYRSY